MSFNRREVLGIAGGLAASSTVGLAGCLDTVGIGGNGGTTPSYNGWLGSEDDSLTFAYADWRAFSEFDDPDDEGEDPEDEWLDEDDFLLGMPLAGLLVIGLGAGFGLSGTGLEPLLELEDEDDADETADDLETEIDELLWLNESFVLAGDVDVDEIEATLTETPDDEFAAGTEYERTDELGDYNLYEPIVDGDASFNISFAADAIAVGDDAIIFADGSEEEDDATDAVEAAVETDAGETPLATDNIDEFEWLLETAGHGHLVFGAYDDFDEDEEDDLVDEADEDDELDDATGLVASLTIEDGESASGEFAATFDELDEETESEIEGEFEDSSADVEFEIDDTRVTASASWDEDVLE
ncbi:hypothetical protein ACLI4Z_12795 [Natrialbaceae archaeon A-arb3/5]